MPAIVWRDYRGHGPLPQARRPPTKTIVGAALGRDRAQGALLQARRTLAGMIAPKGRSNKSHECESRFGLYVMLLTIIRICS